MLRHYYRAYLAPKNSRAARRIRSVSQLLIRMIGEESADFAHDILKIFRNELPSGYGWPGNVRELEQAVRRFLLSGHYSGDIASSHEWPEQQLMRELRAGNLSMMELSKRYCALLYSRYKTYEAVARRAQLDRRTVKKYLEADYIQKFITEGILVLIKIFHSASRSAYFIRKKSNIVQEKRYVAV